ncbi:MAG: Sapep family Mn(2+)-dependent dipeptidase [Clostridia bacterium]|nr:Sapep family Mn(2+)-dependent dipeptidase [Clostridia bacterium]
MYTEIIEALKPEMISSLDTLISIPSKNAPSIEGCPFGKDVNDALEFVTKLASDMGFEARNLGYCAEVKFGSGSERIDIAVHVDVVPEGDGWETDPFKLTEINGNLYGRGTLDDKGPAISVLYALKAMKDSGHIPNKEIRLIFGGAEETGMSDLKQYISENGLPDFAVSPDSSFPVTNAELGVCFGKILLGKAEKGEKVSLVSINGGIAFNCVPDKCTAVFKCADEAVFDSFINAVEGKRDSLMNLKITSDRENLAVETYNEGISVHGSVPETGRNAVKDILYCVKEIFDSIGEKNSFVDTVTKLLEGTQGKGLGIYCKDEMSGEISVNMGMCRYDEKNEENYVTLDIRVPVSIDVYGIKQTLEEVCAANGAKFDLHQIDIGTYMPADNKYLKSLAESYEKVTGKKAEMLCARGVTYAKSFEGRGVAFGPIEEGTDQGGGLHSTGEFINKDAFFKMAEIYAEVLTGLTK